MLKAFFEKNPNTANLFQDLKIWQCGDRYRAEQGKYPVIYLSFFNFSEPDWEQALDYFKNVIANEFIRHNNVYESDVLILEEKLKFKAIKNRSASMIDFKNSLLELSKWLYRFHGVMPIILIDEYDKPLQRAYTSSYYDQMIDFLKGFYTGGLKDNPNLMKGILTGVLKIAKESIFTGMNNFDVYSIFSNEYSEYFGFTEEEVRTMAECYGTQQDMDEVKNWYDGYYFGESEIYNPWSVLQYFAKGRISEAYWLSTSGNDIIHTMFKNVSVRMLEDLTTLVQGKSIMVTIPVDIVYADLEKDTSGSILYAVLLMTGYLKQVNAKRVGGNKRTGRGVKFRGEFMIPNKEILEVYQVEILEYFERYCRPDMTDVIQEAITANDVDTLQTELSRFLMQSTSNFDGAYEVFYHGLMLGNVAMMREGYFVTSNLESGEGRFDIQMEPRKPILPGIIMELKSNREEYTDEKTRDRSLEREAAEALAQIEKKEYITNLRMRGVKSIILYGMAFKGKHAKVLSKVLE